MAPKPQETLPVPVRREEVAIATVAMPEYIQPEIPEVDIEPGEMTLPLVKLLQSNSAEVNSESPLGRAGDFFNAASQENLGSEVFFIPVLLNRKRIYWKDYNEGGGMVCRSYDNVQGNVFGLCSDCIDEETGLHRNSFGPNGEKPLCTKYFDFVCVMFAAEPEVDEDTRVVQPSDGFAISALSVISFGTTKVAAARRLIMIAQAKRAALYANVFKLTRRFVEQKGNKFYVPEIEWYGWAPVEMYKEVTDNIASLKSIAGNPEKYTEAAHPVEEEEAGLEPQGEQGAGDSDDDLPF
jgi:hypothetical protein